MRPAKYKLYMSDRITSIYSGLLLLLALLSSPMAVNAYVGDYDGFVEIKPVSVKSGDIFSFDCTGNDVERQRIEVGISPASLGKTDWNLTLNDTVCNHVICINTKRIERNKFDFDHDESIVITLSVDGEELLKKDFGKRLPISKSPIYLRVQLDGKEIILSAGGSTLEIAGKIDYEGFTDYAVISGKHDITITRHSFLFVPKPIIPQLYDDETSVRAALAGCTDSRCGVWDFFDEDVETRTALKGGRYRLAMLPSNDGGYDLIYLSGAEIEPFRWNVGALKGHISPTPFADTFTLYWIDSTGKEINDGTPYAAIDGALMSLVFPLQKAKFRFVKSK